MSTVITKDQALTNVAANVVYLMEHAGMSVRELARRSENAPMTISRLTRELNMPTADALYRVAEVFGVTLDSLFEK